MDTPPSLRILAQLNEVFTREPCALCGNWDRPGSIRTYLSDETGKDHGWVCSICLEPCLKHPKQGLRDLLTRRAQGLRERAQALQDGADRLEAAASVGTLVVDPRISPLLDEKTKAQVQGEAAYRHFLDRAKRILAGRKELADAV